MAFVILYSILQRDERLSQRFAAAFAVVWFLGILMVYAVPSWGPCFAAPEVIASLPATDVSGMQADLWKHKLFLEKTPNSAGGVFLISGFPSLHLAVPILCGLLFWSRHRLLGFLSAVFAVLTFVSTIYFGWHYLLDDLGSLVLALAAVWTTIPLKRRHITSTNSST